MSKRLTSDWTPNCEEAFGKTGKRGDTGELIAKELFERHNFIVKHCPQNKKVQTAGIDMFTQDPTTHEWYSIQIKTNLRNDDNVFVEKQCWEQSEADVWMHINNDNPGDYFIYASPDMQEKITNYGRWWNCGWWVDRPHVNKIKLPLNIEIFFSKMREHFN